MSRTTEGTAIFHDHPNRRGSSCFTGEGSSHFIFRLFFQRPCGSGIKSVT